MITQLIINAILAILVTLVTFSITNVLYANWKAKRQEKVKMFRVLMATRNIHDYEAVFELNSIHIVFADSPKVLSAATTYLNLLCQDGEITEKIEKEIAEKEIKLFEAMADKLGYKNITWDIIAKPYKPKWISDRQQGVADQNALVKQFKPVMSALNKQSVSEPRKNNNCAASSNNRKPSRKQR